MSVEMFGIHLADIKCYCYKGVLINLKNYGMLKRER